MDTVEPSDALSGRPWSKLPGGGLPVGCRRCFSQPLLEQAHRQAGARLAIGAVARVKVMHAMKPQNSLQLPDDLAAGGVFIEHLPEEAPESAADGIGPLAAFVAGLGRAQDRGGKDRAEAAFQLGEGALADVSQDRGSSAPHWGQDGQPLSENRRMFHTRAVYIPPS